MANDTPLGTAKRHAVCPECMQEHPVMDFENSHPDAPWMAAVRDRVGHITRGDMDRSFPEGSHDVRASYPYKAGWDFANYVRSKFKEGWRAHVVETEMHEQRVYHVVIKGFNAYFAQDGIDPMYDLAQR